MSFHSPASLAPGDQLLFNRYGRGPTIPLIYGTITEAFEAVASAYPFATAVRECFGSKRAITYAELDWQSNIVANALIGDYGVGSGQRVVCVYSRCLEMCVFILGVLKAGAQYVPVDGAVLVEENLRHVIRDSGASLVLCLARFKDKVEKSMPVEEAVGILALDQPVADQKIWRTGDSRRPAVETIKPGDGAYVIYTSGTTGKPKGVDCSHENVCNALLNEPGKLGITVGTNVSCILMLGFDMCAWEILGTLMNGGTLNLRGSGGGGQQTNSREAWKACLERVDVVISTPSGAQKYFPKRAAFPNIKVLALGGEPCPTALAEEWAPHVRLENICGPTEITILNSSQQHKAGTALTIGRPIPNTNVYILDEQGRDPVRIGEPGVMWVGGLGVSRGYVQLEDLTATRYRPDVFTNDGRRMFNTGDLCRWDANGELVPLGRQDDQVKIKGCRVELAGVAARMETCEGVEQACALKIGEELWGFYVASSGNHELTTALLQKHLETRLNFYAVPARLLQVPGSMPITPGGKVDKEALRRLAEDEEEEEEELCYNPDSIKDLALPDKKGFHGQRWLRHKGLSAYRKLFIVVFSANLVAFIVMAANSSSSSGLPLDSLATAVAANLFISVAFRQDHVVNFVFWLATRLPTWTPLWLRRHFARCYHMGGLHSGAAVTASMWWCVFAIQSTLDYPVVVNSATVGLTMVILVLLLLILAMSYPTVRARLHDQFEWTHRFAGWTTLVLVWAHVVVSSSNGGVPLPANPALWLLFFTTVSVALPWLCLRKVNVVDIEPLSSHAVRLHFDFCTPPPGRGVRISDAPLREWHAFATITDPGTPGFSIVVSRAGDWTGALIDRPPTRIWTRGVPASGVLRIAPLFRRIVLVATGSGIGPCLPVILAQKVPCRVFWSTPNPEQTFGTKIIAAILATDPQAVIWNTRERGRPHLAQEAYALYKSSGAECVCVISNGPVTSKLVYALEARGVPAFGPIWDS